MCEVIDYPFEISLVTMEYEKDKVHLLSNRPRPMMPFAPSEETLILGIDMSLVFSAVDDYIEEIEILNGRKPFVEDYFEQYFLADWYTFLIESLRNVLGFRFTEHPYVKTPLKDNRCMFYVGVIERNHAYHVLFLLSRAGCPPWIIRFFDHEGKPWLDLENRVLSHKDNPSESDTTDFHLESLSTESTSIINADNTISYRREADVRDRLAARESGETEVIFEHGRIDIVTAKEIIEVKRVEKWTEAVGQIKFYSSFFPQKGMRIHLFNCDSVTDDKREIIREFCNQEGIRVTGE